MEVWQLCNLGFPSEPFILYLSPLGDFIPIMETGDAQTYVEQGFVSFELSSDLRKDRQNIALEELS